MIINDGMRYTLSNGMSVAEREYRRIAESFEQHGLIFMAAQFRKQAQEAREVAVALLSEDLEVR